MMPSIHGLGGRSSVPNEPEENSSGIANASEHSAANSRASSPSGSSQPENPVASQLESELILTKSEVSTMTPAGDVARQRRAPNRPENPIASTIRQKQEEDDDYDRKIGELALAISGGPASGPSAPETGPLTSPGKGGGRASSPTPSEDSLDRMLNRPPTPPKASPDDRKGDAVLSGKKKINFELTGNPFGERTKPGPSGLAGDRGSGIGTPFNKPSWLKRALKSKESLKEEGAKQLAASRAAIVRDGGTVTSQVVATRPPTSAELERMRPEHRRRVHDQLSTSTSIPEEASTSGQK